MKYKRYIELVPGKDGKILYAYEIDVSLLRTPTEASVKAHKSSAGRTLEYVLIINDQVEAVYLEGEVVPFFKDLYELKQYERSE